jgi:large repetitive protein
MQTLRRVAFLITSLFAMTLIAPIISPHTNSVNAVVISPFTASFNTQINGGVVFAQNSSLTCDGTLADGSIDQRACTNARSGTGTRMTNNAWRMKHVDIDDDPTTFNSSSSQLNLPGNVDVVYAALYWGARLKGTNGLANAATTYDRVKLKVPGSNSYVDVIAQPVNIIVSSSATGIGEPYQAKAIVTDLVKAAGAGNYTVANLAAGLGSDRYAGWTLAVVFEDPNRPLRDITLFDGLVNVRGVDQPETITVSGFTAPVQGAVDATVGIVAYDGDRTNTGDYADFNSTRLASAVSPANDYFNSTIDTFGQAVVSRTPADNNTLGFDVKVADATGLIANSATSASVTVGTKGESVIVGLISTRIDLTAPRFPSVKSVVNTNGNSPAAIGDTLRYELSFTNTGDDPADNFVVTDPIPSGTTYVPGSLKVNGTTMTDGSGDDLAEVSGNSRVVTARLGSGATASSGGRIAIGVTHQVSFEVTVDAGTEGLTITNTGSISYLAVTLRDQITAATNRAVVTVASPDGPPAVTNNNPQLDAVIKMPERVIPGSTGTGKLIVQNTGNADATAVTVDFPIPAEITIDTVDSRCTLSSTNIRCSLATLASGETAIFLFTFMTDQNTSSEQFVSTVTASATGVATASATSKTAISVDADLSLRKKLVSKTGNTAVFSLTASNKGPGTATDVTIIDVLPEGMDFVSSKQCVVDAANDHLLNCSLGTLRAGRKKSVSITVALTINAPLTNEAKVTYAGLDRSPKNNVSTASTGLLPATGLSPVTSAWFAVVLLMLGGMFVQLRRRKL